MKKSMVAVCLAAVCVSVSAEENPILTAARQISAECDVKQASMCWQPAAERVSRLPEPRSKREWEQRVFDYHMLARLAQRVGDLRDARNFYDRMLSVTAGMRDGEEARLLAYSDIAELELSMGEYKAALDHLEPAGEFWKNGTADRVVPEWIILLRCGALIGLKRNDEAEGEMRALIGRLKWNGYTPLDMGLGSWDAMPFGPGVVNPYDIARRIAAYYARTGREDQARALLQLAEEKRQAAARQIALGSSQPWAALRPAAASLQTHDPLAETLGLAVDQ